MVQSTSPATCRGSGPPGRKRGQGPEQGRVTSGGETPAHRTLPCPRRREGGGHWAEQPAGQAGSWTSLLKPPLDGVLNLVKKKLAKCFTGLFWFSLGSSSSELQLLPSCSAVNSSLSLKAFSLKGFGHNDAMFTSGWQPFQISSSIDQISPW